ncbi:hypothetical protein HOY80DRAFT_591323 [Tuber brumale]|nr:hypothetical protein HOY80DRAFT_591323 [Tuber brumale]
MTAHWEFSRTNPGIRVHHGRKQLYGLIFLLFFFFFRIVQQDDGSSGTNGEIKVLVSGKNWQNGLCRRQQFFFFTFPTYPPVTSILHIRPFLAPCEALCDTGAPQCMIGHFTVTTLSSQFHGNPLFHCAPTRVGLDPRDRHRVVPYPSTTLWPHPLYSYCTGTAQYRNGITYRYLKTFARPPLPSLTGRGLSGGRQIGRMVLVFDRGQKTAPAKIELPVCHWSLPAAPCQLES